MSIHIERLASAEALPAAQFTIETQCSPTLVTLLGLDLAGNVLATRTLTIEQYQNVHLKTLILADLDSTLRALVSQPDIFPHPATLHINGH